MYSAIFDGINCVCGNKQFFDPTTQKLEVKDGCNSECLSDRHLKCGGRGTAGDVYEFRKTKDGKLYNRWS